jgi:Domain of unknown function (DUF6894)
MRLERPLIGCTQSQNHTPQAGHGPILFPPEQRPHNTEGEDFNLLDQARGHALQVAKELGRGLLGGMSISVTDEQGVVVFETQIPEKE